MSLWDCEEAQIHKWEDRHRWRPERLHDCDEFFPLRHLPFEAVSDRIFADIGFTLRGAWWFGSWGSEESLAVELVTLLRATQHNVYPCKRWQYVYKYIDIIAEVAPDG